MQLTMKYVLSAFASVVFTWYGWLHVGPLSIDIESALRYGRIGMTLLEKFNATEYVPRVFLAFYGHIYAWREPATNALPRLMLGHRIGLMTGDFGAAGFCASNYICLSFEAGIKLDRILAQCKAFQETIVSSRLETVHTFLLPTIHTLHTQIGVPGDPVR